MIRKEDACPGRWQCLKLVGKLEPSGSGGCDVARLTAGIQAHPQAIPLGSKPLEAEHAEGEALGEKRVPGPGQGLSLALRGLESVAVSIPSVFLKTLPAPPGPPRLLSKLEAGLQLAFMPRRAGLGPGNIGRQPRRYCSGTRSLGMGAGMRGGLKHHLQALLTARFLLPSSGGFFTDGHLDDWCGPQV